MREFNITYHDGSHQFFQAAKETTEAGWISLYLPDGEFVARINANAIRSISVKPPEAPEQIEEAAAGNNDMDH